MPIEGMRHSARSIPHAPSSHSVTIAQPWFEPITQTHFSAGTCFACDRNRREIWVFNPTTKEYSKTACPTHLCMPLPSQDFSTQRKQMLALLRSWITQEDFVPYAFGGCSVRTKIQKSATVIAKEMTLNQGDPVRYYEWPGTQNECPKTGLDCSNLILLSAQMCGIPYICKNSLAAVTFLRPVTAENSLEIGDIIWIDKHLMVVADLGRHTLIEARGYDSGYGKVQEIPLHEMFKDIKTYDQLVDCYLKKTEIERLNKDGGVQATVQVKLLKLR